MITAIRRQFMHIDHSIRRISTLCLFLTVTLTAYAQEENMETLFDIHHILAYMVAGFLITVFTMIFYNRLIYYREKEITVESQRLNAQLRLIMDANQVEAWTYDYNKNIFKLLSKDDLEETLSSPFEFSQFYDRDDFASIQMLIASIRDQEDKSGTLNVRSAHAQDDSGNKRIYEIDIKVLHKDRQGRPIVMLGTQRDVTKEHYQADKTKKLMRRYHTIFNSSLIDMIYYDADGHLTDINDKALETFQVADRAQLLAAKSNIHDVPAMEGIDLRQIHDIYCSSITLSQDVEHPIGLMEGDNLRDKIYYEQAITTITDTDGNLKGIMMAGRNITDMVTSQHHQKEASLLLKKTTNDIEQYIKDINYTLRISDVRLINYYPKTHELEISSDLSSAQYHLPQLRAFNLVHPEDQSKVKGLFCRMDRLHPGSFSDTIHTILRDKKGRDTYLNFNIMPIYDAEGKVGHYFGMCRNDTEMTYTEKRLQEESLKAQEEEQLKNMFLLNMSYELRTPLNAVVGFAELFNSEHSEEDEPIFAEQIKQNTNILLTLINDILFLSRLDAHMIEYSYQPSDFAMLFDGWCYMGWSNLSPNVKVAVENPYNQLIVNIDQQNLGMVIQKLCVYTSLTTNEGRVRAKYEYRHGELMITIEDTGKGMDAEVLKNAFNRFEREENSEREGTGLDLPIVKELVEQMNGTIELQSEPGKGKTFFISIPCEMTSFDRRTENPQ